MTASRPMRSAEVTFAQMALVKLFYAVRRVVDEAGKSLPKGAKVQGILFSEDRYDRADTIGADVPIYVDTAAGLVNATAAGVMDALPSAELRAPASASELGLAQAELESLATAGPERLTAIALTAEPLLWALALTGLNASQLECLEANVGA